jgi:hypothetical protein
VTLTRRQVLGGAVTLVCAPPLLSGCAAEPAPIVIDGWAVPAHTTLSAEHYARLAAMMDALIPGTSAAPGATEAQAAWYLDQLLGAFSVSPPRIFAGGPYSGRHGGVAGFSQFLPLTRVEELRWRTFLEGSLGLPEREWNGPVKGLTASYQDGLDALEAQAQGRGKAFTAMSREERRTLLTGAPTDFVELVYGHAVEGTYGDPVYGGNFEKKGWLAIDYEGDRHPLGFTPAEMADVSPVD